MDVAMNARLLAWIEQSLLQRWANPRAGLFGLRRLGVGATDAAPGTAGTTLTTKGDIQGFSTTNARLAVGTNGSALKADSADATGLKWVPPALTMAATPPAVSIPVAVPAAGGVSSRRVFGDATIVPGADDPAVVNWQVETGVGTDVYTTVVACRLGIGLVAGSRLPYCFDVPAGRRYRWTAGGGTTVGAETISTYSYLDS